MTRNKSYYKYKPPFKGRMKIFKYEKTELPPYEREW